MANLFRAIFKNIFFTGWRVMFQHKEPDDVIETGPGLKPGKTLKEIQEEEKRKAAAPKPEEAAYEDMEYASTKDAKDYDNIAKLYGFSMLTPAAKRLVKSKNKGEVLDIACGTGRFLIDVLKRSDFKATGLDLSDYMLTLAKENIAKEALSHRARMLKGDLTKISLKERSFDAVTCLNALHHIKDTKRVIEGFGKMLKAEGSVILIQDLIKLPALMQTIAANLFYMFSPKAMKAQYLESLKAAKSVKEWRGIVNSTFLKGAEIKVRFPGLIMIVKEINPSK